MMRAGGLDTSKAALAFLLLIAAELPAAQPSIADCTGCRGFPQDRLCGPKSLLMICTQLGIVADAEELSSLAEIDESGTTMAGLQKAARYKGLQTLGLKIGLRELAHCQELAICHLWGNHFVVAQPDGSGGIAVTDPSANEGRQEVPLDGFTAAYSGFVLLVSRQPISPPDLDVAVPDLRFDSYIHDFGALDAGAKTKHSLILRNAGSRELLISQVHPSCTCLEVDAFTESVSPGGQGQISLTFDTTDLRGGRKYALYVESNDPVSPVVMVDILALVKPSTLLVSTRQIHFGEIHAGSSATREFFVKDPGDGSLDVTDVRADSPHLKALLASMTGHQPQVSETVFPVEVTLEPDLPLGPFEGAITVVSNNSKEPELRIPVLATVVGDVEVFPEALFLGLLRQSQTVSKSVHLRPLTDAGFTVRDALASSDSLAVEVCPAEPQQGYILTVTFSEADSLGLIDEEVLIHTDSSLQPTIVVPVRALVEDRREVSETRKGEEHASVLVAPGNASADQRQVRPRRDTDGKSLVRMYVFRSQGCSDCEIVSADRLEAIAARLGCEIEVRYFDIDEMVNWRKLVDLEKKYEDTDNDVPVVFVGTDVIGGKPEIESMLEPAIAAAAAKGGADWPDA